MLLSLEAPYTEDRGLEPSRRLDVRKLFERSDKPALISVLLQEKVAYNT